MRPSARRIFWLITLAAFATTVSGCASTRVRLLDEELARPDTGLTQEDGQKIQGYQLRAQPMTDYRGWARVSEQDSLALWSRVPTGEPDPAHGTRDYLRVPGPTFSIDSVQALRVVEPAPARTAGLVLLVAAGTYVALLSLAIRDMKFELDPQQ